MNSASVGAHVADSWPAPGNSTVKMKDFCTLNTTYSLQKQSTFATKLQEHCQEDQYADIRNVCAIRGRQVSVT
jgi:hypothetical protein